MVDLTDWFLKCPLDNLIIDLTSCAECTHSRGVQDLTVPIGYGPDLSVGKVSYCIAHNYLMELDAINALDEGALSEL